MGQRHIINCATFVLFASALAYVVLGVRCAPHVRVYVLCFV